MDIVIHPKSVVNRKMQTDALQCHCTSKLMYRLCTANVLPHQVKRATPLPTAKEAARAVDSRSLYVRPFPMTATLDKIVTFFQGAGCNLNAVRVRRHQRSRDFKGSVFIEATSVEEANRVSKPPPVGLMCRTCCCLSLSCHVLVVCKAIAAIHSMAC